MLSCESTYLDVTHVSCVSTPALLDFCEAWKRLSCMLHRHPDSQISIWQGQIYHEFTFTVNLSSIARSAQCNKKTNESTRRWKLQEKDDQCNKKMNSPTRRWKLREQDEKCNKKTSEATRRWKLHQKDDQCNKKTN